MTKNWNLYSLCKYRSVFLSEKTKTIIKITKVSFFLQYNIFYCYINQINKIISKITKNYHLTIKYLHWELYQKLSGWEWKWRCRFVPASVRLEIVVYKNSSFLQLIISRCTGTIPHYYFHSQPLNCLCNYYIAKIVSRYATMIVTEH